MAGPLKNSRWEAFAQAVVYGDKHERTQGAAYVRAGYCVTNRGSAQACASRLAKLQPVIDRIRELQAAEAKQKAITRESVADELHRATEIAERREQASALVQAAQAKSRLMGLDIQRVEQGQPGDFERINSTEEYVDWYLTNTAGVTHITEHMRNATLEELRRHTQALEAITCGEGKPITTGKQHSLN